MAAVRPCWSARGLDERVQELLIKLDRVVDGERAHGLRGFAIFLDAKAAELQPKLFNLARREKLSLPLAFPVETSGPRSLDLPEKAQVTVLLYRAKKIEQRFVFDHEALNEKEIERVVEASKRFAEQEAESNPPPPKLESRSSKAETNTKHEGSNGQT